MNKEIRIVSETNEKGIIVYANNDFCRIADFSREELIGKHHNIVRSKDSSGIFFVKTTPKKALKTAPIYLIQCIFATNKISSFGKRLFSTYPIYFSIYKIMFYSNKFILKI